MTKKSKSKAAKNDLSFLAPASPERSRGHKYTYRGLEIRDAVGPRVLNITKRDAIGGQKDPASCAAAKAACRLPNVESAEIYRCRSYLLINKGGERWYERHKTPDSIRSEILKFDSGGEFEPGHYELKVVQHSEELAKIRLRRRTNDGRKTNPNRKARPTPHVIGGIRARAKMGD
jgi:hypothetical protein